MTEPRVLVVEDEALLVRIIRRALVLNLGVDVDEAGNGKAGLERATSQTYDLIVSDITMPELDGISMVQRIREGGGPNSTTPVVILTGHHYEGMAAADELGAHFIGKPFTRRLLLDKVRELLARDG